MYDETTNKINKRIKNIQNEIYKRYKTINKNNYNNVKKYIKEKYEKDDLVFNFIEEKSLDEILSRNIEYNYNENINDNRKYIVSLNIIKSYTNYIIIVVDISYVFKFDNDEKLIFRISSDYDVNLELYKNNKIINVILGSVLYEIKDIKNRLEYFKDTNNIIKEYIYNVFNDKFNYVDDCAYYRKEIINILDKILKL